MWEKKTNSEIRQYRLDLEERNRRYNFPKSIRRFVRTFFVVFSLLCIAAVIIDPFPSTLAPEPTKPIPISELPNYIGYYLIFSFLFAAYRFYLSYFHPDFFAKEKSSNMICTSCKNTTSGLETQRCECGGRLESLTLYKWIEEEIDGFPIEELWIENYKVMKNES